MIVEIRLATEYGSDGHTGIIHQNEHDEIHSVYAHSTDEAMKWIKGSAQFAKNEPDDYKDGRFNFVTEWEPVSAVYNILYGYENVTHIRTRATIIPVNTINVSVGFGG